MSKEEAISTARHLAQIKNVVEIDSSYDAYYDYNGTMALFEALKNPDNQTPENIAAAKKTLVFRIVAGIPAYQLWLDDVNAITGDDDSAETLAEIANLESQVMELYNFDMSDSADS